MTVFGDQQLRDLPLPGVERRVGDDFIFILIVPIHVGAVDEDDHIGVLLDRAALAQVAQHRHGRLAPLDGAGKLGDGQDGHVEFAGDLLECARDHAQFRHPVGLHRRARPGMHQLDVIDDDQPEPARLCAFGCVAAALIQDSLVQVARLGADFRQGLPGRVVDVDFGAAEQADRT